MSPRHYFVALVARNDVKDYGEIREPQIAVAPFVNQDVAFDPGDLVRYLVELKAHKSVWIRHLRKAGQCRFPRTLERSVRHAYLSPSA